jgi:4-hydroxybenzoate polyprenyltransferase
MRQPPDAPVPYERTWAGNSRAGRILALTHPTAVLLFSLVAWLLAVLTLGEVPPARLSAALVAAMAAAQASTGLFNEVFDWRLDLATKPWRAIPAGMISPAAAAAAAAALLCAGLAFAAMLSPAAPLVLFAGAGMAIAYSAKLKRTAFSWVPYAVSYPLLPVWVLTALDRYDPRILVIYPLAWPFALAVHLCNQLRDFDEDATLGVRGLVQHLGKSRSTSLCLALVWLCPIPYLLVTGLAGSLPAHGILPAVALVHWLLTVPVFWPRSGPPDPGRFRLLFRRLQLTGPLMLLAWYWLSLPTLR